MGSTRLPGKVMKPISGKPMIGHQIDRLKKSGFPIILATSKNKENNRLVDYAQSLNIHVYRGSEDDVLDRYYQAAVMFNASIIIRITGDNPLIDGNFIKEQVKLNEPITKRTYLYSGKSKKLPLGMSFEMFTFSLLEEANLNATTNAEREHVTPYFHQNIPGNIEFKIINAETDNSNLRLTVDTEEDLGLIEELIVKYQCNTKSLSEIIEVFNKNPELKKINSTVLQKKWNEI